MHTRRSGLFHLTPQSAALYAMAVCVRKCELASMHTNRQRVQRPLHWIVRCILALSTASTLELRTIKATDSDLQYTKIPKRSQSTKNSRKHGQY